MWIAANCRKFLNRWENQTTLLSPGNLYVGQEATVRTGHRTMDWFNMGKEHDNDVYCNPAYLTYMQL